MTPANLHSASIPARVSVVIPVRNDAAHLELCLAALARQHIAPHEVIVVDNGSTDDTGAVAGRHGARVIEEPETGIGIASAAGYDAATGDIIARVDADSVPAADWTRVIADTFRSRPGVDAITGPASFTDGPKVLRSVAALAYLGSYFLFSALALGHVPVFGSNLAFRRSAWLAIRNEVHVRDTMTHDDLDLSFHLGTGHRVRFVPLLRTGISMRPFSDGRGWLRVRRGFHTIGLHWPHELPWLRVFRRIDRHLAPAGRP